MTIPHATPDGRPVSHRNRAVVGVDLPRGARRLIPYTPPHVPLWQSKEWAPDDWLMHAWRREVARREFLLQNLVGDVEDPSANVATPES